MALDTRRIKKEIESPSKREQISLAIKQQDRIKFHTDTNLNIVSGEPFANFKTFVKSLLPADKFATTMNLLKFPIPTNEITDSIFTKLSKLFEGRNPAFNYQFHNTQERDDWEWYRQNILNEPDVWSNKAWGYFRTEINCIVVVDMPTERGNDRYPQPYFYFVPIESVVSYEVNPQSGIMDWVIFHSGENIIAIDDESYRVYEWNKDKRELGRLISNNPHKLGYCPSRFFWEEALSLSQPDIKKSPISKVLAKLDWYLFYHLSKQHLDLYGSYPIYSAYEEECDYMDAEGNQCSHGKMHKPDGTLLTDIEGNAVICPQCGGKKELHGAGSFITIPVPKDDQPDLRNPIQMLTIDKASLEYNVEEKERLKVEIISSCVGADNTILNEVSLADKQVDASFEGQDVVLNRIKKGFESIQSFVDSTICRLRYGSAFISAKVNYGNEFYTLTPEVLAKRYDEAKKSGASEAELDALKTQQIETQYRHNPTMLQRMIILSDLEPYRHLTKDEVLSLYKEGVVPANVLALKNDFMGYIRRFERENDNILEFGTDTEYQAKINTIYQTLLTYAEERTKSVPLRNE